MQEDANKLLIFFMPNAIENLLLNERDNNKNYISIETYFCQLNKNVF